MILLEELLTYDNKTRYEYCIGYSLTHGYVYGLYNDGWAVQGDGNGHYFFPYWPTSESAELMTSAPWQEYKPRKIDLKTFLLEMLPAFDKRQVKVSIFPTTIHRSLLIDADLLMKEYDRAIQLKSKKYM